MSRNLPPNRRDSTHLARAARVLQEARDPSVPLLERLRLLARASSILEELVLGRRAAVALLERTGSGKKTCGRLGAALEEAGMLGTQVSRAWRESLAPALARRGVTVTQRADLDPVHRSWVRTFFEQQLSDVVAFRVIREPHDLDELPDGCHLLVDSQPDAPVLPGLPMLPAGLVSLPVPPLPRLVELPDVGTGLPVMFLDDVVRANLGRLGSELPPGRAFAIRVLTMDGTQLTDGLPTKHADRIAGVLRPDRGGARVVEFDRQAPFTLVDLVGRAVKPVAMVPSGRIVRFRDVAEFPTRGLVQVAPARASLPRSVGSPSSGEIG